METRPGSGHPDGPARRPRPSVARHPPVIPNIVSAGRSEYRSWSAQAFTRAIQLSGMTLQELETELARMLGRPTPISTQLMIEWRRGDRPVDMEAFAAACQLAHASPAMVVGLEARATRPGLPDDEMAPS